MSRATPTCCSNWRTPHEARAFLSRPSPRDRARIRCVDCRSMSVRDEEMASLWASGQMTHKEIGARFGFTGARVGQICKQQGVVRSPEAEEVARAAKRLKQLARQSTKSPAAPQKKGGRHVGLSVERLRERLEYDPETGLFRRKQLARGGAAPGSIAGSRSYFGYWRISIDCVTYPAHRLAWLYVHGVFPQQEIDHINGDGTDNRIANLRLATRQQNAANRRGSKSNPSGLKGASYCVQTGRWKASIKVNGKTISLGRHKTAEEAHQAYAAAAEQAFGDFARAR